MAFGKKAEKPPVKDGVPTEAERARRDAMRANVEDAVPTSKIEQGSRIPGRNIGPASA